MMHTKTEKTAALGRLLDILDRLRAECPWDREQTMLSLRNQTIEECFELTEAIVAGDPGPIKKELGDLLLHVVFYARIASEGGLFDIADVADALCDKLIYRHPHVFGQAQATGAGQVVRNWEALKQQEKEGNQTLLAGVPAGMPALPKAARIQDKVRAVGFDWSEPKEVWDKVFEEIDEVRAEIEAPKAASGDTSGDNAPDPTEALELEFGDLLFSVVNAARLYGVNPDLALERTNRKFSDRFTRMELAIKADGLTLHSLSPQTWNDYWERIKQEEK